MKLGSVPVAYPGPELGGIGTLGLLLGDLEERPAWEDLGVAFGTLRAVQLDFAASAAGFFLVWTTFPSGHRVR